MKTYERLGYQKVERRIPEIERAEQEDSLTVAKSLLGACLLCAVGWILTILWFVL